VKRPIPYPNLIEKKSDERNVRELVNALADIGRYQFVTRVRSSTPGDGVFKAIWTDTMQMNTSVFIEARIVGFGTGNDAWFILQQGIRDAAGTLTTIGGTPVLVQRETAAATDVRFTTTGETVSLEVRDDGVNSMTWTALVYYMAAG
jgi:hypothetical protein